MSFQHFHLHSQQIESPIEREREGEKKNAACTDENKLFVQCARNVNKIIKYYVMLLLVLPRNPPDVLQSRKHLQVVIIFD